MEKFDVLNRSEFIKQLIDLVKNISNNRISTCFAIDGAWGCGKTFVLDMFEDKLSQIQSEETFTNQYLIIRYNCWKYDYYEEPLVAIVASILSIIEEQTKLFPDSEKKQEVLGILKAVGVSLLSIGGTVIKEKLGIDFHEFQKAFDIIDHGKKEGEASYEKEHDYDAYFSFNKVIKKLTSILQNLAEHYTIVFLIDELDRCLPEYAIKVLERLHHLLENTKNIISIIAIDKSQLYKSIQKTFGFNDAEKYLKKFIQFTVPLDTGVISERITDKFSEYIKLFDIEMFPVEDSIEEFMQTVFKGIDIREQERLVNKAMTTHKLLYSDQKDLSFMCVELLMVVLTSIDSEMERFCSWFNTVKSMRNNKDNKYLFSEFFDEKFRSLQIQTIQRRSWLDSKEYRFNIKNSLYGSIAFIWCRIFFTDQTTFFSISNEEIKNLIEKNTKELNVFLNTIKFIK